MNCRSLAFVLIALLIPLMTAFSHEVHYYYISQATNPQFPDLEGAVCILETDKPLEEVPPGFLPTTKEQIHTMGYKTPSEAKNEAEAISPPDQPYGSFIHCWIGKEKPDSIRGRSGGIIPEPDKKFVACGGFTQEIPGQTEMGLRGITECDYQLVHWFPSPRGSWWRVPTQPEILYAYTCSYKLSLEFLWQQGCDHKGLPSGLVISSGATVRF
jgi:hypothetical protein